MLLPVIIPLLTGIPGNDDSLFWHTWALLSPLLFIAIGLYVFSVAAPASWRESSDPVVRRLFTRYHASEAGALVSLAAFHLGLLFYLGDPYVRTVRYLLVLSAIYVVYFVAVLLAMHFHSELTAHLERDTVGGEGIDRGASAGV